MFCSKCGTKIPDNAKFCPKCGNPVKGAADRQITQQSPQERPKEQQTEKTAKEKNVVVPAKSEPQKFNFTASNVSGEAVLGSFGGNVSGVASSVIPGPAKVIASSVKSFFSSIGSAFKDPKRLIPAIILAVVWLVLNILQACGITPLPTRILSFLTFANGGMSGGVIGAIGGIIGKGLFAGAVVSLIGLLTRKKSGGKRSLGDTLKSIAGVSNDTLWAYLTGIGAAMLLYLFISGGATRMAFMGGIAAAFLAARAALNNGFLKQLLNSFRSKGKSKSGPGVEGLIRGLAVGFTAAALIGLIGIKLILIIIGAVLVAGGAVMMILQTVGVVKLGKGAGAQ